MGCGFPAALGHHAEMSLYDLDRVQSQVGVGLAFQEVGKQRFASLYRIPVCGIEVAGVPGIGDVRSEERRVGKECM